MRFLALFTLLLFPTFLQARDVTGTWRTHKTERGTLIVNIAPCGASLCGKIVDARDAQGKKGTYEHMGKRMIWDMKPTSKAGKWDGGKIWDPNKDRTFKSRMELQNGSLKVSGCVLVACQSFIWMRAR
jgi:uncharacterized protein (DUF2147 family)